MTTAGKVFVVINVLLSLLFMLFAAPVARYRVDTQGQIEKEKAKIGPLRTAVDQLDRDRVNLQNAIERQTGLVANARVMGANMQSEFDKNIAVLTDQLNDATDKVQRWTTSGNETKAEVEARSMEIEMLDTTIADDTASLKQLNETIADLEGRWEQAQQSLADTRKQISEKYQRLLALQPQDNRNNAVSRR